MAQQGDVTELLRAWSTGDREAGERLLPLIYRELKQISRSQLNGSAGSITLQATELVNEAYIRLADQSLTRWSDRGHFFALAATVIRRVLLDHARKRFAQRRDRRLEVPIETTSEPMSEQRAEEIVRLEEALEALAGLDPRQARMVELRYFGGLTIEETADVLGVSPATVKRDWLAARAWLYRYLAEDGGPDG